MKDIFEAVQKLGPDNIRTDTSAELMKLFQLDDDKECSKKPNAERAGSQTTKAVSGSQATKRNWRLKSPERQPGMGSASSSAKAEGPSWEADTLPMQNTPDKPVVIQDDTFQDME